MNAFHDPTIIRPINIVVLMLIVAVLSLRHFRPHHTRVIDERILSGTSILVFAVLAFGTGVNYTKGVEMGPIVPYFTITLCLFLIALATPWRWRLRHR